jgi:hypothetical protein
MMVFTHFSLGAAPLTRAERFVQNIPPDMRYASLLADSPFEKGLTPEQELTHLMAIREARKKTQSPIQRFTR